MCPKVHDSHETSHYQQKMQGDLQGYKSVEIANFFFKDEDPKCSSKMLCNFPNCTASISKVATNQVNHVTKKHPHWKEEMDKQTLQGHGFISIKKMDQANKWLR